MLFTYSRKEGNPVIHKEAIPKMSSIEANEDESYLLPDSYIKSTI